MLRRHSGVEVGVVGIRTAKVPQVPAVIVWTEWQLVCKHWEH